MYSKQYNRISLYDLIFYSKYKNYNRLSFKFKFIYELNSILHGWFGSKQYVSYVN
jgi:hypothetical protein